MTEKWEYCVIGIEASSTWKNQRVIYYLDSEVSGGVRKEVLGALDLNKDFMDGVGSAIARLGKEGWELVMAEQGITKFYFKRRIGS